MMLDSVKQFMAENLRRLVYWIQINILTFYFFSQNIEFFRGKSSMRWGIFRWLNQCRHTCIACRFHMRTLFLDRVFLILPLYTWEIINYHVCIFLLFVLFAASRYTRNTDCPWPVGLGHREAQCWRNCQEVRFWGRLLCRRFELVAKDQAQDMVNFRRAIFVVSSQGKADEGIIIYFKQQ